MDTPAQIDRSNLIIQRFENRINKIIFMGTIINICAGILIVIHLYYFEIEIKF